MNKLFVLFFLIASMGESTAVIADSKYPFARLFTSPEQRQLLDELREEGSIVDSNPGANLTINSAAVVHDKNRKVKLSGVLITDGGKRIVWVDGRSELTKSLTPEMVKVVPSMVKVVPSMVKVVPSLSVQDKVTLRVDKKLKHLKPGQIWLVDENNLKEGYEVKPETYIISKTKKNIMDVDSLAEQRSSAGTPVDALLDNTKSIKKYQQ